MNKKPSSPQLRSARSDKTEPSELFEAKDAEVLAATGSFAVAPSARLFERIVQTTQLEPRFERFADSVASLLDIGRARALEMLARLEDSAAWEPGLFPGMVLQHAKGGPRVSNAVTGFVRLTQGSVFPEHEHLGFEQVLVLQGRCKDRDAIFGPGDIAEMPASTSHSFEVCPGPDLVYLAVVQDGLKLGGMVIGPDDPRG